MQRDNKRKSILREFSKKRKYYTSEAFEKLEGDIIDDLELENEKEQEKFQDYINYLIRQKGLSLQDIKNDILSGVNSQYLVQYKGL